MDKFISKSELKEFLSSAATIIMFWFVIILFFKGCAALFETSEDEKDTKTFLTNLEDNTELRRRVLEHCRLKKEVEFPMNSNVSVSCRKSYKVIYSTFFKESTYNRQTNELIENAKSDWVIKLGSYNVSSGSDIEFFLTSLGKNVHYCVAAMKNDSWRTREDKTRQILHRSYANLSRGSV